MSQQVEIWDWVTGLMEIPAREFAIENVLDFMRARPILPVSLTPYLFYSKGCYTRNLIYKCDLFEVIAICWEVGQASRVHNHRDQNCWMAAPIGRLRVQNFRVENRDAARGACRLAPTDAYEMTPDRPAVVDPAAPVHQVLNLAEYNERAVSIHVYSKPFDSCEVYYLDQGNYTDVPLHYTSEYGRLNPEEKLL